MNYGNSRLTCRYPKWPVQISNPQSGRVLIKKFQGKEVLSENSKRFHVNQMENSKFLNEITYQVHEVGKV